MATLIAQAHAWEFFTVPSLHPLFITACPSGTAMGGEAGVGGEIDVDGGPWRSNRHRHGVLNGHRS